MPDSSAATASGPARPEAIAWRNAIFVIFMLPGLAIASWVARLPAIRDVLDVGPAQLGFLIFAIAAGSIGGLAASSHVVARIGSARTIDWGIISTVVGLCVAGVGSTVGPNFAVVFGGLVLFGAANGMTDVAMNVSGAANERSLGRSIMPVFHAFFSFGTMLGAALGALAELFGVPIAVHFGLISVITVGALFAARRFVQPDLPLAGRSTADQEQPVPASTWRSRLSIWRDPRTLLIGLLVLGAAFAEGSANDWIAIAAVDGHGVSNTTGALVFGLFVTAMTAGRLGGVFVIDRFGRVPVLRGSFILAAVGLLIFISVPVVPIAIAGALLWGLGSALGFPIGMSAAADDPATAAARVSAVATIGYFAFLVGPPVIGLLGQSVGVLNALLVTLVLVAVGAIVAPAAREPRAAPPRNTVIDANVDVADAG